MGRTRARIAGALAAILGAGAIWRGVLTIAHFRSSLAETDPSLRELEEVSALIELGLASLLFVHAVAAAYWARREIFFSPVWALGLGLATAGCVGASFAKLPYAGAPGVLAGFELIAGVAAGFVLGSPWLSVYAGAAAGSAVGFLLAAPSFIPFALLAVAVPPTLVVLFGAALGKGLRRISGTS